MMAANPTGTSTNRVNWNRVNRFCEPNRSEPEPDFGVDKIEMQLGPSLDVVFYAVFEFSNENRIGANLGVVLGELLYWYFYGFFNFLSFSISFEIYIPANRTEPNRL